MRGLLDTADRQTGLVPWNWLATLGPAGEFIDGEAAQVMAPSLHDPITADISNWDQPTFDPKCFKEVGVKNVIIGCQRPAIAEAQIMGCQREGINVAGLYAFLYFGGMQPMSATRQMLDIALKYNIEVTWLDAEADDPGAAEPTPGQRNAQLGQCVAMCQDAKKTPAIYTAPWWFIPKHNNSTAWMRLPLWLANYGTNDGTMPPMRSVDFGGWTHCVIHQYTSLGGFCGRAERDRNHVWTDCPGFTTEEGMSSAEYEELKARLATIEAVVVGVDADGNSDQSAIQEILRNQVYVEPRVTNLENLPPGGPVPDHRHSIPLGTGGVEKNK